MVRGVGGIKHERQRGPHGRFLDGRAIVGNDSSRCRYAAIARGSHLLDINRPDPNTARRGGIRAVVLHNSHVFDVYLGRELSRTWMKSSLPMFKVMQQCRMFCIMYEFVQRYLVAQSTNCSKIKIVGTGRVG